MGEFPNKATQFDSERARAAGRKSKRKSWAKMRAKAAEEIRLKLGIDDPDALAVFTLVDLMKQGDMRAVTEWLDRELGKSRQKIEQKSKTTLTVEPPLAKAIREAREADAPKQEAD